MPVPLALEQLPPIHFVLISHSHYDHLDWLTVEGLLRRNPDVKFLVPLGLKAWFVNAFLASDLTLTPEQVYECDWWDEVKVRIPSRINSSRSDRSDASLLSSSGGGERTLHQDQWDEANAAAAAAAEAALLLTFTCTPAQHGSGRCGLDSGTTLWSSWYLTYKHEATPRAPGRVFRAFFGGDTGYQFHDPPSLRPTIATPTSAGTGTGPSPGINTDTTVNETHLADPTYADSSLAPTSSTSFEVENEADEDEPLLARTDDGEEDAYPACPAFKEITERLGPPDLNMLPISVGATLSFLKGFDPFPPGWSPFPCGLNEGLTAANHMTPHDAVRCFRLMNETPALDGARGVAKTGLAVGEGARDTPSPVALAIHWGTFVGSSNEAAVSLHSLREACRAYDVTFARCLDEEDGTQGSSPRFVALNPGEAINMMLRPLQQDESART